MKLYLSLAVIVVACFTTSVLPQLLRRQQQQQQQAQYCIIPGNYNGTCVAISNCPEIVNALQAMNQNQAQQYLILSQRNCNFGSSTEESVICCTNSKFVLQGAHRRFQRTASHNALFSNTYGQTLPAPPLTSTPSSLPTEAPTRNNQNENINHTKAISCKGPDTRDGICVPIRKCQILIDELQTKQTDEIFRRFLRASNTICGNVDTNVCCPSLTQIQSTTSTPLIKSSSETPTRLPTVEEGCGVSNNILRKLVYGEVYRKGAWPWIALLGYHNESSSSTFKCGGALVTARHVITAAHCLRNDLSFVRLGEHDLTTDTEARHEDIRIVKSVGHPDFNKSNRHNDIAILYLERNVEFTESILPICLPTTSEFRYKSYIKYMPFVVGWGKTMDGTTSLNARQELQIPIYDNQVCRESYKQVKRSFPDEKLDKAVLCAGVFVGGSNTCQGDAGGPLMIAELFGNDYRFYLIGVVSYGSGCDRPEIPGVYSSTQYFMDWIIEKIADTP